MRQPYTGSFSFQDAVLHRLIIRQPYTGSFSNSRCSFTRTHHQATLHRFLPSKMQFHTDSSSSNSTQVPSFQDAILHGLIISQPYTGSFLPRCKFTRTHHQVTLHRFLLSTYKITIQQEFLDGIYKPISNRILSPL